MIFFVVWAVLIIALLAPAFPTYDVWFWLLTFFIPPLVLIPIVEAVSR